LANKNHQTGGFFLCSDNKKPTKVWFIWVLVCWKTGDNWFFWFWVFLNQKKWLIAGEKVERFAAVFKAVRDSS